MSNINVNRSLSDQFYRYKMPRLLAKVEEKGNGIKTVVVNIVEVAKALNRPPSYPTKYFGCELGAQTQFDLKNERYIVNGSHEAAKLQDLLDGFIRKFVLCASCDNPETVLTVLPKKGVINTKCIACGYNGQLDSTHKLTTFILKNPPGQDPTKNAESGKKGRRKGKGDKTPKRQQNGDGNESQEKTLLEKDHKIKQLYDEVENLSTEVEQQKQRNNELREKNWKTVEALKTAEKASEDRINELEEKLRLAAPNTADSDRAKELSDKLQRMEQELNTLRQEANNNLQKYESILKENTNLNTEIQKLQGLKADLETRLDSSQQSKNELREETNKIEAALKCSEKESNNQIDKLEEKLRLALADANQGKQLSEKSASVASV